MPWVPVALAVGQAGLGLYLVGQFWSETRVGADVEGLHDGTALTSAELAARVVRFRVDPADRAERASLRLDGQPVSPAAIAVDGATIAWTPGLLGEGNHQVTLTVPRPVLAESTLRWRFTVDDTPPHVDVPALSEPVGVCDRVTLRGNIEAGSTATLDGRPLDQDRGAFALEYDRPPLAPLDLVVTDRAGNRTQTELVVPVRYPGGQGVHVTAAAWGYEPLRRGVLALIDAGKISVVELDLKDEGGIVGYDSKVDLAVTMGAVRPDYRIGEAVAELKRRGVRVVGRIVAFRDARLASWAWDNGHRDWVVQTQSGGRHVSYGGFANLAHPDVQGYNLDIALEAVRAGVDDILWDYVRRPEGDPTTMVFPGLTTSPTDAVVGFLARSRAALREHCAFQGAAVFGIAADRPEAVGQDIPRMARQVDYLAPMLYPSHWGPGEYGVANPNRQPADIVTAALADFQAKIAGTGIALVPWLQDFSLGHPYGPAEVRAQIDAAAGLGVPDWLLWNAGVQYTADALDPSLVVVRP